MHRQQHTGEKTAKIFLNGRSQAVRLPMEFRFDTDEVYIRRDTSTGDVILSVRPGGDWQGFMELREQLGASPADFPDRQEQGSERRDPFEGWKE